jgi:hypothetical protein
MSWAGAVGYLCTPSIKVPTQEKLVSVEPLNDAVTTKNYEFPSLKRRFALVCVINEPPDHLPLGECLDRFNIGLTGLARNGVSMTIF